MTSSALQSRKWQLTGMSQWCRSALCGHPLPALTDNWTHGAASRHTIAPISHTRPSPRSHSYYLFPVPLKVEGWVGLSSLYSNVLNVACSGPGVSQTRNLSVTSPILYHYTTAPTFSQQITLIKKLKARNQHYLSAHMTTYYSTVTFSTCHKFYYCTVDYMCFWMFCKAFESETIIICI